MKAKFSNLRYFVCYYTSDRETHETGIFFHFWIVILWMHAIGPILMWKVQFHLDSCSLYTFGKERRWSGVARVHIFLKCVETTFQIMTVSLDSIVIFNKLFSFIG